MMSPKQQRIVDGHDDFPWPKNRPKEWSETDIWGKGEDQGGVDGRSDFGLDGDFSGRTTASIRADAVMTRLDMSKLTTDAKKGKFKRNLVIYWSHSRAGFSQRLLAEVFGLPRSRIGEICKEFEELTACSS